MKKNAYVLALFSALLFGASTPASKLLLGNVSPFVLAGLLYIGSALAVAPWLIAKRDVALPWMKDTATRRHLIRAMIFGGICAPVLLLFGLKAASSASVALWLNLELVATMILGLLFFKENISLFSGLAGLGMLSASVLLTFSEGTAGLFAGSLVLLACVCWGLDNHHTALIDGMTPAQTTFWKGMVAGPINLLIGFLISGKGLGGSLIWIALGVGVLAYGISIMLYIQSAQILGATRSQIVFSTSPFFGVLLSVIMLNESISMLQWVAAGLMALSVTFLIFEQHGHAHEHKVQIHEHLHRHDDGHHNHPHPGRQKQDWHSHRHTHQPIIHAHVHLPDLHHRHEH